MEFTTRLETSPILSFVILNKQTIFKQTILNNRFENKFKRNWKHVIYISRYHTRESNRECDDIYVYKKKKKER